MSPPTFVVIAANRADGRAFMGAHPELAGAVVITPGTVRYRAGRDLTIGAVVSTPAALLGPGYNLALADVLPGVIGYRHAKPNH